MATVASVNGRTKGDFRVLIVLSENAFTVRAFGKIVPRRGVTGGRFINRNRIILFTAARCPSSIRITTSRLCRIFSRIIVTSRGRGYSLGLSAPSAGRCGGRVGGFRCGGSRGIAATLHGSCGLLVGFLVDFTESVIGQRDFLITDSQTATAEDHFRSLERQHPFIIVRHDTGHQINHTGHLVCHLILKVRLDGTDLIAALAGQVTASVLMADQDDVFIVQIHKPLQGVQELASDHIPRTEGIIRFMLPALTVTDVNPARFINIFQKVNHDGSEIVLFLFQFGHGIHEHFIGQLALGDTAFHRNGVTNGDIGGIHKLDVAIRVQHQGIGELIGKEGFAAEGCAVKPHNLLLGGVQITAFILGK